MTILLDPEENETKALLACAGDLAGKRVLEIGCGDGRLTWRFAPMAAQVIAIDADAGKISRARQNLPPELRERVTFYACGLEQFVARFPPGSDKPFDLALLSWSL